ncbi:hypothetical protein [Desulfurococcus amylolyticus]|uniref:hypothetical protein n=1 Tax=Desulfurococcus amylolyticus TaxID=94694 RepID=UPI00022DFE57|nr:hypothetical protein [Desulfurococcus amylolyticus]
MLVYRDGRMLLMIAKRIPKPAKYPPRGVLAVDINERQIVLGNTAFEERIEIPIDRALHYKILAEELMKRYGFGKYRTWTGGESWKE